MEILIIASTNRKNARTYHIADLYSQILWAKGVSNRIIQLSELPNDFIETALYENSGKNEHFNALRQLMWDAQKFVFIVPEYNGSFPGILKLFIDALQYPGTFTHKKIALVGLSTGVQGGALALSHLGDILSYLMANVLGNRVKLIQIDKHMKDSTLENTQYTKLLEVQADEFINF